MPGTLFVVATPIGNLEDVTARALRVLADVTLIAAEDTRRTSHLLARYAITTPTTSLHEHNESKKTPSLIARLTAGADIALVSDAGTPGVSDPGGRLVRAAIDAGVPVVPIPGPSAPITLLMASGLVNNGSFAFVGFPPVRSKDRTTWFKRLRAIGGTVVFFEAPHRLLRTLTDLLAEVGDCQVIVGRELTKIHEELIRGPISSVVKRLERPIGEFTVAVMIGHITEHKASAPASDADTLAEFGYITESGGVSRRSAVQRVARKLGLAPGEVYKAIERAKKLVK